MKTDWNEILRKHGYIKYGGEKFGEICRYAVNLEGELRKLYVPDEVGTARIMEVVLGNVRDAYGDPNARDESLLRLTDQPRPFDIFQADTWPIESGAIEQMTLAARMYGNAWGDSGFHRGAIMADGHQGYGLPIGGVTAMRNFVSPYGVGVDIGCMVSSIFMYLKRSEVRHVFEFMRQAARFGSADHDEPQNHTILDDPAWRSLPSELLSGADKPGARSGKRSLWHKAAAQLGTLGGGNHFIDLVLISGDDETGLYAVVIHSGSRGLGATIANYFSELAQICNPELPFRYNGFLADSPEGRSYIDAMQLAARYAATNHQITAARLSRLLAGLPSYQPVSRPFGIPMTTSVYVSNVLNGVRQDTRLDMVWNHHNLARLEEVDGEKMWVHRKGATPAHTSKYGVIGGSCGGHVAFVRGLGNQEALNSTVHGAGRPRSRTASIKAHDAALFEQQMQGVLYHGIDRDETPQAYKPLWPVLDAQSTCAEVLFVGKVVAVVMAGESGRDAGDGD